MSFMFENLQHLEQDIVTKFLFKSEKNVDEAFELLRKVYGDQSISRASLFAKYEHQRTGEESKSNSPSDENKSEDGDDVESTASSNTNEPSSSKYLQLPNPLVSEVCYNMRHENRGKCIIFDHEKFEMYVKKRVNTVFDTTRLRETFEDLGFDVEICNDFTYSEIISKLDTVSQLDHANNDCLCIIVLTHRLCRDIICAKDVAYETERLWKPFINHKTLVGKPKLFFIQADRSYKFDDETNLIPYCFPHHQDFLIVHASIQGYISVKNFLPGTWFIQTLCDVLDKHGKNRELKDVLTLTARSLVQNNKEIPSITMTLTGLVYFPSKK